MGAPLVCCLLCTKLLSQQMHGDIKIHFFALITKTTMIFTKNFIARRRLDAMCQNSNLITKICENIENFAHLACEKCLYNSIFALPSDDAKMLKTSFFVNFHEKIDFGGSQTLSKQRICSKKRFWHFGDCTRLYTSIYDAKNVAN